MKKIHLISAFILASIFSVDAQLKYGPRLSLGNTSLGSGNGGLGIQAGLFVNAELRDRVGVQGEVLYAIKTGNTKYEFTDAKGVINQRKTKYRFTYIDIPVYGYVPLSGHITFLLGPQFGIVNKATQQLTGDAVPADEGKKENIADAQTRVGLAAGLDFFMSSPLRFGLRFTTNGGNPFAGQSTFVGATMAYYMDW